MLLSGTLFRRRSQQAKGSDGDNVDDGEGELEEREEEEDDDDEEGDIMLTDDASITTVVDATDKPPLVVVGGHRGVPTEIPSIIE